MSAGDDHQLVLAIPPEPSAIGVARLFAAASCRHLGIDEERIGDVKVAVSEAVTNAVKAHISSDLRTPVRIVLRTDTRVLEVSDAGDGFEPVEMPIAGTPPGGLYEGSLGLSLIQSLFPDVKIERNPDRGMTVRFSLDLASGS